MKRPLVVVGLIQVLVLAGFCAGIARRWFPLGVRGEWEWLRLGEQTSAQVGSMALAGFAIAGFAVFAAIGARSLGRNGRVGREVAWVSALAVASVLVQSITQEGAPAGMGLAKWIIALQNSGSSGYHTVARDEMPAGLGLFLQNYPAWVDRQDSLHIGTHPPGLFILARAIGELTRTNPGLARWVVDHAPGSASAAIGLYRGSQSLARDEAAALTLTGALTLVGSALAVIPLYWLGRAGGRPVEAWAAASLWPLLPAAVMFQPTADTAFPLVSLTALAAAAWSVQVSRPAVKATLAVVGGLLLGVGMQFTLAFLAVGLVVAIVLLASPGPGRWWHRWSLVAATGLGFLGATAAWWMLTSANPVAIWWINQQHHAGFYRDYPRTRLAWTWVNLVEATVAIGLPASVWLVLGIMRPRSVPVPTWATLAVLVVLTVSGRSLSEVARLWLPLEPVLLLGSAAAWNRWGASPPSLGWTVAMVGMQTLILEQWIQVVYPI